MKQPLPATADQPRRPSATSLRAWQPREAGEVDVLDGRTLKRNRCLTVRSHAKGKPFVADNHLCGPCRMQTSYFVFYSHMKTRGACALWKHVQLDERCVEISWKESVALQGTPECSNDASSQTRHLTARVVGSRELNFGKPVHQPLKTSPIDVIVSKVCNQFI